MGFLPMFFLFFFFFFFCFFFCFFSVFFHSHPIDSGNPVVSRILTNKHTGQGQGLQNVNPHFFSSVGAASL